MRHKILAIGICLIFLSGCSEGPPRILRKTADEAMNTFFVEMASEYEVLSETEMVDYYQISDTEWCLAYEGSETLHAAIIWAKQNNEWVRIELQNYETNCNWAR